MHLGEQAQSKNVIYPKLPQVKADLGFEHSTGLCLAKWMESMRHFSHQNILGSTDSSTSLRPMDLKLWKYEFGLQYLIRKFGVGTLRHRWQSLHCKRADKFGKHIILIFYLSNYISNVMYILLRQISVLRFPGRNILQIYSVKSFPPFLS